MCVFWFDVVIIHCGSIQRFVSPDELTNERAKNKMLQEEMEATLHDIQNM